MFPIIYSSIFLKQLRLIKLANTGKLLSALDRLNPSEEIKSYILSLPSHLTGYALGKLSQQPNISLPDLTSFIDKIPNKTKEEEVPAHIPEHLKKWYAIQIRKKPELASTLSQRIKDIQQFEQEYDQQITSYDAQTLLDLIDKEQGHSLSSDPVDTFFNKLKQLEDQKLQTIRNNNLIKWSKKYFLEIRRDWAKDITNYLKKNNISFSTLLSQYQHILDQQQQGLFRGQQLPHTPLHNPKHHSLLSNIEFMEDWVDNQRPDLSTISLPQALQLSELYHQAQIQKGEGLQYDPLNASNIVKQPNDWENEEYKGYFIIELKSENDLKVEGNKMQHCVGDYYQAVKSGSSRIFSLRNVNNPLSPILTIETDSSGLIIRQDYGKGNSKIDSKYHQMVDTWNNKMEGEIDIDKIDIEDIPNIKNTKILEILAKSSDVEIRRYVAENPNISFEISTHLSQDSDVEVRRIIADCSNSPVILTQLSQDPAEKVRHAVALNLDVTPDILTNLTKDSDVFIRRSIAKYSNLPMILAQLAQDTDVDVKCLVARNPATSSESLTYLAQDSNKDIKKDVAQHLSTPDLVLIQLARDSVLPSDWEIIFHVIMNPNSSSQISRQLATTLIKNNDVPRYVREILQEELITNSKLNRQEEQMIKFIKNNR